MEIFNLNLIPSGTTPVVHASQYDIGRQFRANLFEGSSVFTLDGTETVSVYVSKPDGNMVTESVTNTSSNYVVIETTEQMTACDGANLCELRIEKGGNRIGTLNFILECEKSPDTGITSQTEINNLETLVDGFTALAVADQYDSANVIFDSVPTAGHGNGYAVTSEGVKNALLYGNETISIKNQIIAGWLTAGRQALRLNVILPKKIPSGKTLTLGGTGRLYSDTGVVLIATSTNLADWGTWTYTITENGVECLCSFSTAFSSSDCTNNALQTVFLESSATLTVAD